MAVGLDDALHHQREPVYQPSIHLRHVPYTDLHSVPLAAAAFPLPKSPINFSCSNLEATQAGNLGKVAVL